MQMRFYLGRPTYFEFAFSMMTQKIAALRRISKLSQACRRKILTFLSAVTKDVCFLLFLSAITELENKFVSFVNLDIYKSIASFVASSLAF